LQQLYLYHTTRFLLHLFSLYQHQFEASSRLLWPQR
jgi:hypothetical protein